MRSASGDRAAVSLTELSAAAPNTYSDSHGTDPEGPGGGSGVATRPVPILDSFPQSRPFKVAGSSHEGMSRLGRLGCGADVEVSSPVARGRGACERDTPVPQLVEWPAWPCGLLDGSKDLSLFHVSPSILATGYFIHAITSVRLLPSGFSFCPRLTANCPLKRAGSAAHPSDWLPATQPPTHTWDSQ